MLTVRARGRDWLASVVPALLLCLGAATPLSGQFAAVPQQDLTFGVVMPGLVTSVLVDDAARRAEWLLTGRGNTTVSFVLPTALVGPGGAQLPLVFAAGDAGWMRQSGGPGLRTEDPNAPFAVTIPNRQALRLFLGGAAQPAAAQPAGGYTATITVIIAQP